MLGRAANQEHCHHFVLISSHKSEFDGGSLLSNYQRHHLLEGFTHGPRTVDRRQHISDLYSATGVRGPAVDKLDNT